MSWGHGSNGRAPEQSPEFKPQYERKKERRKEGRKGRVGGWKEETSVGSELPSDGRI
jgi:hypothetical protein